MLQHDFRFEFLLFSSRMRIVDDDVGWAAISTAKPEKEEEEDGDLPVVCISWRLLSGL